MENKYTGTYINNLTGQEFYSNNEPYPSDDGTEIYVAAVDGLENPWKLTFLPTEDWDGVDTADWSDWNVVRAEYDGDIDYIVISEDGRLLTIRERYIHATPVVIDKSTWNGEHYTEAGVDYYPCYVITGDDTEVIGYRA